MTDLGEPYTEVEARINRIFDRLDTNIRSIIMGQADKAVTDVTEQLRKASAEIDAEVNTLKEAGVDDASLAGLKSIAQALDDRNADSTPAEPEPQPAEPETGSEPATPAEGPPGEVVGPPLDTPA